MGAESRDSQEKKRFKMRQMHPSRLLRRSSPGSFFTLSSFVMLLRLPLKNNGLGRTSFVSFHFHGFLRSIRVHWAS